MKQEHVYKEHHIQLNEFFVMIIGQPHTSEPLYGFPSASSKPCSVKRVRVVSAITLILNSHFKKNHSPSAIPQASAFVFNASSRVVKPRQVKVQMCHTTKG